MSADALGYVLMLIGLLMMTGGSLILYLRRRKRLKQMDDYTRVPRNL